MSKERERTLPRKIATVIFVAAETVFLPTPFSNMSRDSRRSKVSLPREVTVGANASEVLLAPLFFYNGQLKEAAWAYCLGKLCEVGALSLQKLDKLSSEVEEDKKKK